MKRYLPLVLATAFWGANFNLGKFVVKYVPPFTGAALRFTIASGVIAALYAATVRIDWADVKAHLPAYCALGIVGVFGFNVLMFAGLKYTSSVNGALIMATNPLMTMLLAAAILHDRMRLQQKAGVVLSLVGIFFVITGGSWALVRTMSVAAGDGLMLLACACWAVYGVLVRKFLHGRPSLAITAITMVVGTAAMIPFALFDAHPLPLGALPASVWLALLVMAIPGAVMAYLFWNRGVATLGPARTSIFFNLVPVFTVLIATAAGEPITRAQVLGGLVVIAGCVLSQLKPGGH